MLNVGLTLYDLVLNTVSIYFPDLKLQLSAKTFSLSIQTSSLNLANSHQTHIMVYIYAQTIIFLNVRPYFVGNSPSPRYNTNISFKFVLQIIVSNDFDNSV